ARDGLREWVVAARGVDPGRDHERRLEPGGVAGREDPLPVADPLEAGDRVEPDAEELGLAPEPPGAPEVEQELVVAVLGGPAGLPAAGQLVKGLDRDAGTAADVLDVDERHGFPLRHRTYHGAAREPCSCRSRRS